NDEMQPQHRHATCAALDARGASGALDAAARLRRNLAGELEPARAQRPPAEKEQRRIAVLQGLRSSDDRVAVRLVGAWCLRGIGDTIGFAPRRVCRKNE